MKQPLKYSILLTLAGAAALGTTATPVAGLEVSQDPQQAQATQFTPFTQTQLEELVAPVALYADPLLAQVLLAATFPDQIADAAAYVRARGTEGIDDQYWDVSVKAVAHYPTVLNLLDSRRDWATSLGQAYAAQSSEVMRAVQSMRQRAQAQGNLQTTPEQQVVVEREYIRIWPAQPQVIYVPVYDPIVYYQPVFYRPGFHLSFSFGLPFRIGAWLMYDCDWPGRRIYYTGWYGGGWISRSRPHVHITNIYVNPGYRRVVYDRRVLDRRPDYGRGFAWARSDAGRGVARSGDGWRTAVPRDGGRAVATGSTSRGTSSPSDRDNRPPSIRTADDRGTSPRGTPPAVERGTATGGPSRMSRPADQATPPRWTPPTVERGTATSGPTRMSRPADQATPPRWTPPTVERGTPASGPSRLARPVESAPYSPPRAVPSSGGSGTGRATSGAGYERTRVVPSTGSGGSYSAPSISRSQAPSVSAPRAPRAESGSRPSVSSGGYRGPSITSRGSSGSSGSSGSQGSARAAPRSSSSGSGGSGSARASARSRG